MLTVLPVIQSFAQNCLKPLHINREHKEQASFKCKLFKETPLISAHAAVCLIWQSAQRHNSRWVSDSPAVHHSREVLVPPRDRPVWRKQKGHSTKSGMTPSKPFIILDLLLFQSLYQIVLFRSQGCSCDVKEVNRALHTTLWKGLPQAHVGVFDVDNESRLNRRDRVIYQGLFTRTSEVLQFSSSEGNSRA